MEIGDDIDYLEKEAKLIDRVKNEYKDFIETLKKKTPDEIIAAAYEIVIKEDIMGEIECGIFSRQDIDVLLTLQNPIDYIYREWISNNYSVIDFVRDTIKDVIGERAEQIPHRNCWELGAESEKLIEEYITEYEPDDAEGLER